MSEYAQHLLLLDNEQFKMTRLQVYNWGTFSGIHDIAIAEKGFLFIGRSGAGKSTLLDAFSTLLVPPRWVDFNAAAREAERSGRDRDLMTYIRGAWKEQNDESSGNIVTRYLRPNTTWSALALTYRNKQQKYVTLIQIFWLRGNANQNADIKRFYLIAEQSLDVRELEDFGKTNFDVRKLKQQFANHACYEEFRPYCERFCRLLGIENEMALRLLHKTQSAKNLGDINVFLRDYMLEKPDTFDAADRLVQEFNELDAAYQVVIRAREQIKTLVPVRESHQQLQTHYQQRTLLNELQSGINHYTEKRRMLLLKQSIAALTIKADGIANELQQAQEIHQQEMNQLQLLQQQHREQGGERLEQWKSEKQALENQRNNILRKQNQVREACSQLGWAFPETPHAFAERLGEARHEVETWQQRTQENRDKAFQLKHEMQQLENEFARARYEIDTLKRQPSNIPAQMIELRREITQALGLAENALPFVGELIEVKPEESIWQGAIERVLHGFAISLLVDEKYYAALTAHLNQTDLKQRRLVYYKIHSFSKTEAKTPHFQSLLLKTNLKNCAGKEWLQQELRQRFDYACVDNLQDFRRHDRALTKEGQVKHSNTRHEKDDRMSIHNKHYWVLGFDNREKRTIFEMQAQQLAQQISQLQITLNEHAQHEAQLSAKALQCQSLINLQWQEIDVTPLLLRISALDEAIKKEISHSAAALQQLIARMEQQKIVTDNMQKKCFTLTVDRDKLRDEITRSQKVLDKLLHDATIIELTPHQQQGLDARFERLKMTIHLDNLDKVTTQVVQHMSDELTQINKHIHACIKVIENHLADFIREWPVESNGLDAKLEAAPDFIAILTRLESDGLPAHEQRFFDLLQNQSNQNLAALATHLDNARKDILDKMELVNDSLSQVPFNQTIQQRTYLRIEVSDKQLSDVREFKRALQNTLHHSWNENKDMAEARFLLLKQLVNRLASQEPQAKQWRNLVLDVRQHIEFIGRELDEQGHEVEVYRSGAGKSGGQRQKLATTCLAAALRYQLGGTTQEAPLYAPVILDEAFDKADNEFTALAMNIFVNFGFQMIVATPLKSVMTLEPFIGGACFVDISEGNKSGVLLIGYNESQQQLKLPDATQEACPYEVSK